MEEKVTEVTEIAKEGSKNLLKKVGAIVGTVAVSTGTFLLGWISRGKFEEKDAKEETKEKKSQKEKED